MLTISINLINKFDKKIKTVKSEKENTTTINLIKTSHLDTIIIWFFPFLYPHSSIVTGRGGLANVNSSSVYVVFVFTPEITVIGHSIHRATMVC